MEPRGESLRMLVKVQFLDQTTSKFEQIRQDTKKKKKRDLAKSTSLGSTFLHSNSILWDCQVIEWF